MRVAALVLRRTRPAGAAQDERLGPSNTHQLMVSSGAKSRVRRTMGARGFALADAVLRAQVLDIAVDGAVHVAEGVVVGLVARDCVVPGVDGDEMEFDAARMPAEAAVGLSPQREGEARFGVGDVNEDGFEGRVAELFSAHEAAFAGDHEDHQRQEAEHDS